MAIHIGSKTAQGTRVVAAGDSQCGLSVQYWQGRAKLRSSSIGYGVEGLISVPLAGNSHKLGTRGHCVVLVTIVTYLTSTLSYVPIYWLTSEGWMDR